MGRPGITQEQVFAAADELHQSGITPTLALVRERTGGSNGTVLRHLGDWKRQRAESQVPDVPEMPGPVAAAARAFWASAWNAGQSAIQSERDALASARREVDQERTELLAEISDLEAKVEEAAGERQALDVRLRDAVAAEKAAQEALQTLRVENARLSERADNSERRAQELREQVERMERELARLAERFAQAAPEEAPTESPAPLGPKATGSRRGPDRSGSR